jgi:hypothetical protein
LFLDFLLDYLFFNLALMGSPPDLISETMAARTQEYSDYRQWVPAEGTGVKGTLLWEAAKRVGEPVGRNADPGFLLQFIDQLLKKFEPALVYELLVGKADHSISALAPNGAGHE